MPRDSPGSVGLEALFCEGSRSFRQGTTYDEVLKEVVLSWSGGKGLLYTTETSTSLQNWTPIKSDELGTGDIEEYRHGPIDSNTVPTLYYRIFEQD